MCDEERCQFITVLHFIQGTSHISINTEIHHLTLYACTPCSHNVRILQKQLSGTASWFSGESLSRNPFDVRTNENTVAASTTPPETAHGKTEMVFGLPHHTRPRQGHIEQQRASRRVVRPPSCAAACFNLQRGRSYGREIHHYENTENRVLVDDLLWYQWELLVLRPNTCSVRTKIQTQSRDHVRSVRHTGNVLL